MFVRVALDHPLPTLFDYRCEASPPPAPGTLVRVPFGKRHVVGLVCEVTAHSDVAQERLRSVDAVCAACPLRSRCTESGKGRVGGKTSAHPDFFDPSFGWQDAFPNAYTPQWQSARKLAAT